MENNREKTLRRYTYKIAYNSAANGHGELLRLVLMIADAMHL